MLVSVMAALALLLGAYSGGEPELGADRGGNSFVGGDGILDCPDGELPRGADIEASAADEQAVVASALARWAEGGAELVALPAAQSWTAVVEGRDVAVVVPERSGDGSWTVRDVLVCGAPATGAAPLDTLS